MLLPKGVFSLESRLAMLSIAGWNCNSLERSRLQRSISSSLS